MLPSHIKKSIQSGTAFFATVILLSLAYATIGSVWTSPASLEVGAGSGLTASSWNALLANFNNLNIRSVPSGAVMAFNLTACPTNWTQADGNGGRPDLRGQFIRGLNTFDNGITTRSDGNQDPATRTLGNFQQATSTSTAGWFNNAGYIYSTMPNSDGSYQTTLADQGLIGHAHVENLATQTADPVGNPRTWAYIRPRNIALIYCIKD